MIDFTTTQLSWIVVGVCSIGGAGYVTMNEKVDSVDKKLAVSINSMEHSTRSIEQIQQQLLRIEEKIDRKIKQ